MKRDQRLDMKLQSVNMLRYLMGVYHYSVRTFAEDVQDELDRGHRAGGPKATCSKSHVGALRSGAGNGVVSREIAVAIETLLHVDAGVLFRPRMSSVQLAAQYPPVPDAAA